MKMLGLLNPVSNLTLTRSEDASSRLIYYHYTWKAPFSLNITAIEPDIAYYVHIYTVTCPDQETIVNVCNVTVPSYTIQAKQNELYKLEVRPRIYSLTDEPGACTLSRSSNETTAAVEYEGL